MFEIPIIGGDIPRAITGDTLKPGILHLGKLLAEMEAYRPADLRTGAAGVKRMIEKVWQRWHAEDGLPEKIRELPIDFVITDTRDWSMQWAKQTRCAWLILTTTSRPTRWYIGYGIERHQRAGIDDALLEHGISTLYAGMDALCYAPKPPEFLAWAKAFWWNGADDAKPTRESVGNRYQFPTRRRFDHRYPAMSVAPRRFTRMPVVPRTRNELTLAQAIVAVETLLRTRNRLAPNMHEYSNGAPRYFGPFVRWEHGDYLGRLVDDYYRRIERLRLKTFNTHGAWPLATVEDVVRARRGMAQHRRLCLATVLLLKALGGHCATQSMGSHW